MSLEIISQHKIFAGTQLVCSHQSTVLGCTMRFGVFLPDIQTQPKPAVFWLSGLTCTEENFITKSGFQQYAAECGLVIINPDTSPRGLGLNGEDDSYDIGTGAGFYCDATEQPWAPHYKMYSYITQELPSFVAKHFPVDLSRLGIFGHSMGGHGALAIALKNPDLFKSVSAFSPICSTLHSPWGQKALSHYFGDNQDLWANEDVCELTCKYGWQGPTILVDQGSDDPFLTEQLKPQLLTQACSDTNTPLTLRMQPGYDHSYYFIASFIGEHIHFHAQHLT